VALVEARRLLQQREQPLTAASSRVLLRRGLVVLERHAKTFGEPLDGLREVELLGLTHERDHVAALAAAEAVEELVRRVDREARCLFVVEGTKAGPARPGAPELRLRLDDLDHVGRLDGLAHGCLADPRHYSDSAKLIANLSVMPAT
jgi:hypothetical protein